MEVFETTIPGVVLLQPRVFGDSRGFFLESWNKRRFAETGIEAEFVQDNHSRSLLGTLRGLHYQIESVQGKLVRVTQGKVFDVAVDLRADSPYCGESVCVRLDADSHQMLWIPPGFAHGFYVLSDFAEFQYKCTNYYAPQHEVSIRWDDPDLAIPWPLIGGQAPTLSAKDEAGLSFAQAPRL